MATKKQKRAAALAKREAFMSKLASDGQTALERDREVRAYQETIFAQVAEEVNNRHREILEGHGIL